MADSDFEAKDIERKVHDLASAMNRVKTAQASRDDVVVEMKHAKVSRLELLANDLAPVFNDLPNNNDQFEFSITNGEVPRLWVDMTSFVRMGKDGREYEFVKDTRLGRTILGRSDNREKIGKRITDYIAERVLERERAIEGDWLAAGAQSTGDGNSQDSDEVLARKDQTQGPLFAALWFLGGVAASFLLLIMMIANDQSGPLIEWIKGIAG